MNKKKIGPNPLLMPMPVVIIGARVNDKPSFVMVTGCVDANIDGVVKSPIYCVAVIFQALNILHVCLRP